LPVFIKLGYLLKYWCFDFLLWQCGLGQLVLNTVKGPCTQHRERGCNAFLPCLATAIRLY
jgi:hypothetical protein